MHCYHGRIDNGVDELYANLYMQQRTSPQRTQILLLIKFMLQLLLAVPQPAITPHNNKKNRAGGDRVAITIDCIIIKTNKTQKNIKNK